MATVLKRSPLMRTERHICMILLNALRMKRKEAETKRSEDIRKSHPLLPLSAGTLTGVWPHKMTLSDRKPVDMDDNLTGV